MRINSLLTEVAEAVDRDAAVQLPTEKDKQAGLAGALYDDFKYDIRDIVYRKRA